MASWLWLHDLFVAALLQRGRFVADDDDRSSRDRVRRDLADIPSATLAEVCLLNCSRVKVITALAAAAKCFQLNSSGQMNKIFDSPLRAIACPNHLSSAA
jgi:hypothetical protein